MIRYKMNDATKLESFNNCAWAVCYEIPACTQDDKTAKEVVIAVFTYLALAEDFIYKVLQNPDRFYIRSLT